MLGNEELLIVMGRQINFDRDQKRPRLTAGPPLAFIQRFLVDVLQTRQVQLLVACCCVIFQENRLLTQIWERDYTNVNAVTAKRDYLLRRVCLPARNNLASNGRMFIKFDI